MRKTALLLAFVVAAASPGLAVAKTVRHRHHTAAAAAPPPEPTVEQLNEGSLRMWHDLFMAPAYMATGTEPHYSQSNAR